MCLSHSPLHRAVLPGVSDSTWNSTGYSNYIFNYLKLSGYYPVCTSRFETELSVLLMDCMYLCVPTIVEINKDFFSVHCEAMHQ
jgi:hypothetical protein